METVLIFCPINQLNLMAFRSFVYYWTECCNNARDIK